MAWARASLSSQFKPEAKHELLIGIWTWDHKIGTSMCQGESKAEQQELTEIGGDPANNDCSLIVRSTAD